MRESETLQKKKTSNNSPLKLYDYYLALCFFHFLYSGLCFEKHLLLSNGRQDWTSFRRLCIVVFLSCVSGRAV